MPFVKLDCGMLDSTLWIDRAARELFITALLMAEPCELREPEPQIKVDALEETGFVVPPGWYGFVPAAGSGIVRRCGEMTFEHGIEALRRLGDPEKDSRTPDFEGRRMVRIDGGYLILNFDKYRKKDYTAAERSKRYRENKAASRVANGASRVTSRSVTQAEAEAEVKKTNTGFAVPACFEKVEGFTTALAGWIEARTKKKNPPTGHAIQLVLNKLTKRPNDAIAVLNMAAERGWSGVEWKWFDKDSPAASNGNPQGIITAAEALKRQQQMDAEQERKANAH